MANAAQTVDILGERQSGQDVRTQNVMACGAVANIVKTSLGPVGLDKMLVDDIGDVTITNDGATILKMLEVEHPAAKVLVELAELQDREVGDGTTSVVIIAAELLKRANDLVRNKIHPTSIISGYRLAMREACKYVEEKLAIKVEKLGKDSIINCAKTSMSSKLINSDSDFFANMVVDAVQGVKITNAKGEVKYPIKSINIMKAHGKSSKDSYLLNGYALNTGRAAQGMPTRVTPAKIACLDFNLQKTKMQMGIQVLVTDPRELEKIRQRESDITKERIEKILKAGANVVLTTKGIDDMSLKYFVEAGAIAVRRVRKEDLRHVAKATGATMVTTFADMEGEETFDPSFLGHADEVVEERIADDDVILVKGTKTTSAVSIVLRGANDFMLDEMERSLHDSICIVKRTLESNTVVAGGGAVEAALSVYLENLATTLGSREQLAIAEFAESFLIIPKVLSVNAAKDATELVAKLRAYHHADDAMKIAEVNAEKVEILSNEVVHLKGLLDSSTASEESKNRETEAHLKDLESEVWSLKEKLDGAKLIEGKLSEAEKIIEELKSEIAESQKTEADIRQQLEEWKEKTGSLEVKLEEITLSEKFKSDSLASTSEELGKVQSMLQDRESEIEVLKGKTTALEIEVARLLADVNDTSEHLDASQQEVFGLQTTIDVLMNRVEAAEQAASEALNNEKNANIKIEGLTEEKNKLVSELNDAKDREVNERKTVEDLTAALNKASCEAQEAHEMFQKKEDDYEHSLAQIGDLKMALKSTKESYEAMLDEANHDITCLRDSVERLESEVSKYREECESKELDILTANKQSEQEIAALKVEAEQVVASLQDTEHELQAVNEEKERLQEKLMHTESAVVEANKAVHEVKTKKESLHEKLVCVESVVAEANMAAQEAKAEIEKLQEKLVCTESAVAEADKAVQEAKAESLQLKERLLDKENALQSIAQENDELRMRETEAKKKVDELSALLAEAMTKKHPEEEEKLVVVDEAHISLHEEPVTPSGAENEDTESYEDKKLNLEVDAVNGDCNEDLNCEEKDDTWFEKEAVKTEFASLEAMKVGEKEAETDRKQETESSNDEVDSKEESSTENANGMTMTTVSSEETSKVTMSPTKPQQQPKKNKHLLKKFGSLLKKKNSK